MNTQTLKPELKSPETKATFFAQYWGQSVLVIDPEFNYTYRVLNRWMSVLQDESHLLLTPLKHITDEDAIEVAKICLNPKEKPFKAIEVVDWEYCKKVIVNRQPDINNPDILVEMFIEINYGNCEIKFTWEYHHSKGISVQERHCPNSSSAIDYLRLRGYAVNWNGHKVKELIEAGYCQLKGGSDE